MKYESKSARNRTKVILFFVCSVLLSACADVRGPTWLTGEPDESVLAAPRIVATPKGAARDAWPNLSEVPAAKPKFSDLQSRVDETIELKSDNLKAQAEMERIRNARPYEADMAERTSVMPADRPSSF